MNDETVAGDVYTQPLAPILELASSDMDAYNALQNGAVLFELPQRHISQFVGAKAADALNGLVSNDVLPLAVGRGLYAAALTPKGKMLADVSILRVQPESFLVTTTQGAGSDWWGMVKKYVNPRLAQYKDESSTYAALAIYGPNAAALLARLGTGGLGDPAITEAMEEGLRAWPDFAHASFALPGLTVRLIRMPHLGAVAGFEILVPAESLNAALAHFRRVGAVDGSSSLWQLAQLEGARPVLGLDMDASTIPQEANLDDWNAISYEKGCYTGQETVARIHFRGHVNKHLRGLQSQTVLLPASPVHDVNGKLVGDVRRSGISPRLGNIAIAMLRRELAAGDTVSVHSADAVFSATVRPLPFVP